MEQFVRYLKTKRKTIAAFTSCAALFALSFFLYGLPLSAILYPCALCAIVWAFFVAVDYSHVKEKKRALAPLKELDYAFIDEMPSPKGSLDEDYQEIIRILKDAHVKAMDESSMQYNDMVNYYTVWAHQIKTPIAAMRLRLQNEDSELSRNLKNDLNRIENYVEMVLTFVRLESRDSDYVIRECNLDSIIRTSIKKFAGEFISRKLSLGYETIERMVLTDEKWLGFVVEQLLSNALKYTREGSISISLEGDELCIRDTGIGIAPEDLPRIFEHGYTGFNGRNDRNASGIGLYLCKRICTNLGHELTAESTPGEGSCFRINLKREKLGIE